MSYPSARSIIAVMLIAGGLVALVGLFFVPIPAPNEKAADIVLGAVTGAFITAANFYLGSSHSSSEKDQTIAAIASSTVKP